MITPSQRQILEAVLESLPERYDTSVYDFPFEIGFNKALIEVRAIINEFLEPAKKEFPKGGTTLYPKQFQPPVTTPKETGNKTIPHYDPIKDIKDSSSKTMVTPKELK